MPALTTFKLLGLATVASYALARLAVRLRVMSWHRAFVVAVPRHRMPAMPRGFVVREVGIDELLRWPIDVTPAQQEARFAQGIACLAAFNSAGELTGVVWMSDRGCTEGDVALLTRPPEGGAWDTGMWIDPEHRLGRSFQALWAGVAAWLDARGLTASYSAIADYNVGSLGAHRRLGMERLGRITALRIGQWQWITAGSRRWNLVRPGQLHTWQVPPMTATAPPVPHIAQAPSIAG